MSKFISFIFGTKNSFLIHVYRYTEMYDYHDYVLRYQIAKHFFSISVGMRLHVHVHVEGLKFSNVFII